MKKIWITTALFFTLIFLAWYLVITIGQKHIAPNQVIELQNSPLAPSITHPQYWSKNGENIMILGEWLPYNWLKTYGLNFHNVRLQNLSKTILDILSNLDSEKELAKKNAKNIEVISKWSSCISKWKDIYEATEENK